MPSIFSAGSARVTIVPDFSNAQKRIGEFFAGQRDIHVTVNPDVDQTQLGAAREEIRRGASTEVKIGIDRKYLGHAISETFNQLSGFPAFTKTFETLFGPKSVLVTSGAGALIAVASAAGQAAGAIGLLPAGIVAAAAPIAALTIGLQGVGDAFKAIASGDIDKINESLANLAPAARDFVTQVRTLGPAWKALRLDVQQQLFAGLGDAVTKLARADLPILRAGLANVADSLNGAAKGIINVLTSQKSLADFRTVFANIGTATRNWSVALAPITQLLVDITTVGSQYLPGIAQGFANAATAAANWVARARESGRLNDIFATALARIHDIWALLVQVGGTIGAILKPAAQAGATIIQVLTQVFGDVNRILSLNTGQSSLSRFFNSISTAVQALRPGIAALVDGLVNGFLPAVGGLVSALAPVVSGVLSQFGDAIKEIAPLIVPTLANALRAWFAAIAPLIPVLTDIAKAVLPVVTKVLQELAPVVSEVASVFGGALEDAIKIIAPVLPLIADAFLDIVHALEPLIPPLLDLAVQLLPPILEVIKALLPVIVTLAKAFADLVKALLPILQPLIDLLNIILPPLARLLGSVLGKLITDVLVPALKFLLRILGDLIQGIADFVKAAFDFFSHFTENVKRIWTESWTAIRDFFVRIWHDIRDFFVGIWDAVTGLISRGLHAVSTLWTNSWNAISDTFSKVWNGIRDFVGRIWSNITGFFKTALDKFVTFWGGVWDSVGQKINDVFTAIKNFFKRVWADIVNFFRTPINWIIDKILNHGLFAAWNWIADHIGKKEWEVRIGLIPEVQYYSGGFTGQIDPHKIAGVVHGGEYVFTANQVDRAGGPGPFYELASALDSAGRGYETGGSVEQMTWRTLWSIINGRFGDAVLTSAYRPGDSGYHGKGEAIDVSFPGNPQSRLEPLADWITHNYPNSTELIHNPNGSIKNGRAVSPGYWGADVWAAHANHVHWAMTLAALNATGGLGGRTPTEPAGVSLVERFGDLAGVFGNLAESITGPLQSFAAQFRGPTAGFLQGLAGIPKAVLDELWLAAKGVISTLIDEAKAFLDPSINPQSGNPDTTNGLLEQAWTLARNFGWTRASDKEGLNQIAIHESGWNIRAQNPTSSASGIWQLIDATWRAYRSPSASSYAHAKDAPAEQQDLAADRYIRDVYQTPTGAWIFWQQHHYYDRGGYLPPGFSTVYNGTGRPEPVLTAAEHDGLIRYQSDRQRGSDGVLATTLAGINNSNIYVTDLDELMRVQRRETRRVASGLGVSL